MRIKIILLLFIFLPQIGNTKTPCSLKNLEALAIQQGGRVKPLFVHANETIKYLSGKKQYKNHSKLEVYCLLSFSDKDISEVPLLMGRIDHVDLRKTLSVTAENPWISYHDLKDKRDLLQKEMGMGNENKIPSSLEKSAQTMMGKLNLYENIISGKNWKVPVKTENGVDHRFQWKAIADQFKDNDLSTILPQMEKLSNFFLK